MFVSPSLVDHILCLLLCLFVIYSTSFGATLLLVCLWVFDKYLKPVQRHLKYLKKSKRVKMWNLFQTVINFPTATFSACPAPTMMSMPSLGRWLFSQHQAEHHPLPQAPCMSKEQSLRSKKSYEITCFKLPTSAKVIPRKLQHTPRAHPKQSA